MVRSLLARGLAAGLVAGALAFAFAFLVGEPQVGSAIGVEESLHHVAGHEHGGGEEEELVSRGVQRTLGLLTGVGLYGIAIGGLLAVVVVVALGRVGSLAVRPLAALTAGIGFVAVVGVPFLKYPGNPPGVGEEGSIGDRTGLYYAFVALSALAAAVAVGAGRAAAARLGTWSAWVLAGGGYLAVVAVLAAVLPGVDEVPAGFPADLLWQFRLSSIGTQAVLWASLGIGFGALAHRAVPGDADDTSIVDSDGSPANAMAG
jgi:hypothetical protein